MSVAETLSALNARLQSMEAKLSELGYNPRMLVETAFKRQYKTEQQSQALWAPIVAYCVSTIDPLKLNRIRFFSPFLHEPNSRVQDLPFARQVSSMGGHDDCGLTWIPPAGSTVVIIHENGDRRSPLYLGTTFHSNRGPGGNHFPYPIEEFQKIGCNRGEGYLVGANDGSQAKPPWNTENYGGYDAESAEQIETDPDAQRKLTYPNIYGFKTPGKHWAKFVDGDYRCQNHWKRIEIGSACGGGWMCFKDDWLHPGGQWANPKVCNPGKNADKDCLQDVAVPGVNNNKLLKNIANVEDKDGNFIGPQPGNCLLPNGPLCHVSPEDDPACANPYFKRLEECRPYRGAPTPQNNKLRLSQSGIQFQSRSGHQIVLDDKVEEPKGKKIQWQDEFNFGCTDKSLAKMFFKSCTGHLIEINDKEDVSGLRGVDNGIVCKTATGHQFKMIDHTLDGCIAGDKREIVIQSSSDHLLVMHDEGNEQCSPTRAEGGIPTAKAKKAWVMLRSGYGLLLRMDDDASQQDTQNQAITLLAPRKDQPNIGVAPGGQASSTGAGVPVHANCKQGHIFRMQLRDADGGFILTSSGGYYICASMNHHITEVGREDCPAHKVNTVFGHYIIVCKQVYVCKSSLEIHIADKYIILGAGKDCPAPPEDDAGATTAVQNALTSAQNAIANATNAPPKEPKEPGPCLFPIIVAKCPKKCPFTGFIHWTELSMSDRVFASASPSCAGQNKQIERDPAGGELKKMIPHNKLLPKSIEPIDQAAKLVAAEDPANWTGAKARATLAQGNSIVTPDASYNLIK